jgi:hypothetical protein
MTSRKITRNELATWKTNSSWNDDEMAGTYVTTLRRLTEVVPGAAALVILLFSGTAIAQLLTVDVADILRGVARGAFVIARPTRHQTGKSRTTDRD